MSYKRGRRFEYRVKEKLERLGYVVIRSAASKPIDLVALKAGCPPLFIECKLGKVTRRVEIENQKALARLAGAKYLLITKENLNELLDALPNTGCL